MTALGIPRAGSCRTSDPDYDPLLVRIGRRIDVLLNGEPVSDVVAYNCDEGWVRAMKRTKHGRLHVQNGIAAEQLLRGDASVRWR